MAEPNKKHPRQEKFVDDFDMEVFGRKRTTSIRQDICVCCGQPATEFKDEISKREYTISGSCQKCQDVIFAPPKVRCPKCNGEFEAEEVEFLNIEEDFEGKDVQTFTCPECNEPVKSHIYL